MKKNITYSILAFALLFTLNLSAQSDYKDEATMIKDANSLFENEEFLKAKPLFSQLVSLYPKDASYNMKYGACLFYDESDKGACLKYLKYAAGKSEAGPEANYYYAIALHGNYDFNKAIKYYKKFKTDGNKKLIEKWQIDRQIEMCDNGKTLLSNVFDLNVIDKKEISRDEFFRIYDLGEIGGKIIVKPDEFKSKLDLKSGETFLIHLPADANVIYFSGYGESMSTGKDIFRVRKSSDNTWSEPENIGNVVNTDFDEDFPFMHPDGSLYFASKGHNSMGGYDLFKSEFNESTGTWSKPENLNFAISSAFDDLLFITDYKKQLAYFASSRSSSLDKLNVYRVQIARKPFDKAFLSGNFIAEGGTEVKSAKITIYDLDNNQKIGTYFTNKETGKYNIALPKGGKTYKFVVETDDESPVHTGKVEVPVQTEMASLKQEIRLVGSGDEQKLVIKNMFNESAPLDEEAMASLLRESSGLEVNTTEAEVLASLATAPAEEEKVEANAEISIDQEHKELVAEMEALVISMNKDIDQLKNRIAFGFKYSYERAVMADQMYDQVEVSRQEIVNEKNEAEKQKAIEALVSQKEKLDPIASDAIVSFDFTKSLANEYDEKLNDVGQLKSDVQKLKNASSSSAEEKQMDVDQFGPKLKDLESMNSAMEIAPQRYAELLAKNKEKLQRQEAFYKETKSDIEQVRAKIKALDKEISEAKNKKTIDQKTEEKGSKEIDLQDLQYEFDGINKNYRNLQKEVRNLESDSKMINAFISKIKSNTVPISSLSSDDQAELNKIIAYLKEQRMLDDMIGSDQLDLMASDGRKEDLTVAHSYDAVDNKGAEVSYDELYLVNLSAIELLSDDEKKYDESAKLYENWANTIKEDKEIKENDLKYTKNKGDKEIIEERLKILDEKEREYRQISVEYLEKKAALNQVALSEGNEQVNSSEPSNKGQENESDNAREGNKKNSGSVEGEIGNISSLMAASFYTAGPGQHSMDDINATYQKAKGEYNYNGDDPADEIAMAAFELQWAKSIDNLIDEKKEQLNDPAYKTDWPKIQGLIDEYETEKKKHLQNASGEFTAMQIDQQMGDESIALDEKYYIAFDPEKADKEAYNAEYLALTEAVENHQILSREEKDRELSMIHNYWSMTIQDDIIWHENEKTKLKSQAELNELDNEILDLNVDKKRHVSLSNEFYQKYKASKLYQEDLSTREKDALASSASPESKSEAKTFGKYADLYANYQKGKEEEIQKMQVDLESVGGKGEKQQLQLALTLKERENKDVKLAEEELNQKSDSKLVDEQAQESMNEKLGLWQEEAEDYVFTKKDFLTDVPESGLAYDDYKEARNSYERVQYLESQKKGLLETSVVNKNAEEELLLLLEDIEAEKLKAYEALARSNKAQFNANKKEISRLMEFNPDLEKTNPRLFRDIKAAEIIFAEAEKYQANAQGFKSNTLKFDIYDQAQFMSEYVLTEQQSILSALKGETYTGELSFMAVTEGDKAILDAQVESFKITQAEMDAILINPIYVEYEEDRRSLESAKKQRIELEAEVLSEEQKLKELNEQRNFIVQEASGLKGGKKKKLMKEADVYNQEIEKEQKVLDSVALEMVQKKEEENTINRNSARLLKEASVDDQYKMVMLAELRIRGAEESTYLSEESTLIATKESLNEAIIEEEVIEGIELPGNERVKQGAALSPGTTLLDNNEFSTLGTEIPQDLQGDLFITAASATVSPYSENKPIPVDVEMPTGLIFKVQVGAYRNAIPQDLFKGFAPLMGEKLNNGITRYTAGLFRDFGNANKAKSEIRKLGYEDAFVVAFYNGQRISFQELQNIDNADLDIPTPLEDNTINGVPLEVFKTPSIIDDPGEISAAIAEQTNNTMEVKGIFFTVQVGVYTNTLLPEKLKVLRELNSELLPNGNVRYSVGQFKNLDQARNRRLDVQGTVGDAFVTAYSDGSRITVSEAIKLLEQLGQ